ncbi:protein abrupt-like [Coccinella septempunctata]|uniref:protein abrupt-like n=1 Tax=Coccinella septempunctata TaxID=41139 RepID=UPI001D069683|nr:protein abrupt-like [Coccinella septempunctata]
MSAKHFCLKWNSYHSNIVSAFESLQHSEELVDVTLTCEGINLKAHKFILSACSPYFRTVFKENPCPHPIVILKDVVYTDLIAVINFMYHGEVMVSEEQLPSFLSTAKLLQVSGLNSSDNTKKITNLKRSKLVPLENPSKKIRTKSLKENSTTNKSNDTMTRENVTHVNINSPKHSDNPEIEVKTEKPDEEVCADVNENISNQNMEKTSILEAALDSKRSILERSLTAHHSPGKSPSSVPYTLEPVVTIEMPKNAVIIRKHPEGELEKILMKSPSSDSSSSVSYDRPSEILQQSLQVEGETYEFEGSHSLDPNIQIKSVDIQPHHSSQCGTCPHCGQIYSNQSALKYHVRLVHSDLTNMYCCHLCPEAFDFREGYKKHMSEAHSIRN